ALGLAEGGRRTRDALRPLGDDFQARMVDQIQAQLGVDSTSDAHDATPAPDQTHDDDLPDNVVRLSQPRRPWIAALAATAVAAVGLAFVAGPLTSGPAMPEYSLEFRGGAVVRGNDDLAPLQVGDTLQAIMRPASDVQNAASLTVYRRDGDALVEVDAGVQWADSGAARVSVVLDDSLPLGDQDWWFVVAADGREPTIGALTKLDAPTSGKGWQVLRQRFELVP
ncbi:MAG: hypothetical protein AAFU65_17730, partial [Pseudomonadota bacterium]